MSLEDLETLGINAVNLFSTLDKQKSFFYCHYCHYCHKRPIYRHSEVAVVTVTYDFWYKNEQKQDKNISLSM